MSFRLKNLWIFHLLGWLLFLILPLTIMSREPDQGIQTRLLTSASFWLFGLIYLIVFYSNTLFFFPKLFLTQRLATYLTIFVIGLLAAFYTQPFENLIFKRHHSLQSETHRPNHEMFGANPYPDNDFQGEMPPPVRRNRGNERTVDFVSLVLFVIVWVVGLATKISEQWQLSEKRAILSETNKARAELSFFKAQINPHFLFNTLNNIYSLAVSNSEHTAPSIMKLSKMMRYITDEATEDFVPLADEILCLENYVDLQRLRLNAKTKVQFVSEGNLQEVHIAPLILMTFVENAFKYGVSNRFESLIDIKIAVIDSRILFSCKNQIFETDIENESTGIGLANTRKRLDALYGNGFDLKIAELENRFEVNLELTELSTPCV